MEPLGLRPTAGDTPGRPITYLSGNGMPDTAARKFSAVVARVAHAPIAVLLLADGDRLRMVGGTGVPGDWPAPGSTPAGSTLAGRIVRHNHPVVIEDLAEDPRVPKQAPALALGVRGYAGFPVRDPGGDVYGVLAVMDYQPRFWTVDELAAADDAAQACTAFVAERVARDNADTQRRFLDALLQSLQTGVAACDAGGDIVFTNEALQLMIGSASVKRPLAEWSRHNFMLDRQGRPLVREQLPLFRALAGDRLRDEEFLVGAPGERIRTVSADAQPITGPHGNRLGAVVCLRDVTDHRWAERFHEVEQAVSDTLAHAGSVPEAGPRVLKALCAGFGWPYAQLWLADETTGALVLAADQHGDGVGEPLAASVSEQADALVEAARKTGKAVRLSDMNATEPTCVPPEPRTGLAVPACSGDRTLAVLAFFTNVLEDPADPLVAFLSGVAAHIAEFLERRRAEELTVALAQSKQEYLALIGHELRTPLTSITAYIDLLREVDPGTAADELPGILDVLGRNSEILRHIVDDLLDLAGIDNGHANLAEEPVDLSAVVVAAAGAAEPVAAANGVVLDLDVQPGAVVMGDERRLRQVADHLLANAIGHSPEDGRVTLSLTRPAPSIVELTVTDDGLGIPNDDQERVFSRFYRSPRTRENRLPGVGLGLTVSRAIVERHHGTIRFVPCPPPGTRVTVRLPACRS